MFHPDSHRDRLDRGGAPTVAGRRPLQQHADLLAGGGRTRRPVTGEDQPLTSGQPVRISEVVRLHDVRDADAEAPRDDRGGLARTDDVAGASGASRGGGDDQAVTHHDEIGIVEVIGLHQARNRCAELVGDARQRVTLPDRVLGEADPQ